jgi:hypothetical protein
VTPAPPVPCRCDFDVAARGWDHHGWDGEFFPLDLPREWRLTFYANHFRSVLVPGRMLLRAESTNLAEWFADTPEEFRFFLEITVRLVARFRSDGVTALLRWLEPLRGRIGGLLLLGFSSPRGRTYMCWLEALGERFPIHTLTEPGRLIAPAAAAGLVLGDLRQCWHPGLETADQAHSGCLGLVLGPGADLPGLRRQIESFMGYARRAERATLCFAGCPPSLHRMQRARTLVELLGG